MLLLLACSATDDSGGGPPVSSLPPLRGGIPAYILPGGSDWDLILQSASDIALVIANPASGPGTEVDPGWQEEILAARDKGVKVLGYVPTMYGERSVDEVVSDIQRWSELYQPGGIFLDMVPAADKCETAQQSYYSMLGAAREMIPDAVVVMNWGTLPCESWMADIDIAVTFEGFGGDLLTWEPAEWAKNFPPEKFWVLAHTTPEQDALAALEHVRARNVRYVYVTDDVLDNPWDQLASYWPQEAAGLTP